MESAISAPASPSGSAPDLILRCTHPALLLPAQGLVVRGRHPCHAPPSKIPLTAGSRSYLVWLDILQVLRDYRACSTQASQATRAADAAAQIFQSLETVRMTPAQDDTHS